MEASACSIEETAQVGGGLGVVDVEVDTRGGGALSGMADADHLRIGEDHVRRLRAICAVGDRGLVAHDVVDDAEPRVIPSSRATARVLAAQPGSGVVSGSA